MLVNRPTLHPGELVKVMRAHRGLTVEQYAALCKLNPAHIEGLEKGDDGPFTRFMARLFWERILVAVEPREQRKGMR